MYLQPNITIASDIIAAQNDQLQQSPALMNTAYKRALRGILSRWKQDLQVEPPEAANYYPIHWASIKQRRAFFATQGFGAGIPTQRTHLLSQSWDVQANDLLNGGVISVSNDAPEAQYVIGDNRQPMFDGTTGGIPWLDADVVNAEHLEEAEDVLIETWLTIADEFAGVT